MKLKRAFTLIELLIVVAIIAILAAIAVPNFLEAQVRAKVSRCKTDMRSVEIAIESYRIDTNKYPTTNRRGLCSLTTPIAYLSANPDDPFQPMRKDDGEYLNYVTNHQIGPNGKNYFYYGPPTFTASNVAIRYNICWKLTGLGPDRGHWDNKFSPAFENVMTDWATKGIADVPPYDSTNGTVSRGNIERYGPGNIPEQWARYIWNNKKNWQ